MCHTVGFTLFIFAADFSPFSYGKVITTESKVRKKDISLGAQPVISKPQSTFFLSVQVCPLLSQMSSKLWECVILLLNDQLSSSVFSKIG